MLTRSESFDLIAGLLFSGWGLLAFSGGSVCVSSGRFPAETSSVSIHEKETVRSRRSLFRDIAVVRKRDFFDAFYL